MTTMQDHPVVTMSADRSTVLPRYDVVGCIYAPSRKIAESRLQQDIYMDHAEIIYPAGQIRVLTPDVLDTVRLALIAQVDAYDEHMAAGERNGNPGLAGYFAGELWAIDRARRSLEL